jgi:hypothetical protein
MSISAGVAERSRIERAPEFEKVSLSSLIKIHKSIEPTTTTTTKEKKTRRSFLIKLCIQEI